MPSKKDRLRYSWQSIHDDDGPTKPRIHVIKIVSTASTAAAGIGQEEAFGFSCSTGGRRIAVYNSARLFILQTAALPINVSQEYALKRKPLAVEIVDEGTMLAVLADEHTINVYDLSHQRVHRVKTIRPDHPATAIALNSTGGVLAAAYEGGVEIFSLAPSALSTDRRAIRSPRMDKLRFSDDGSTLMGTTTRMHASFTVVVSVPVFPSFASGVPTHEELKEAWCSNILNPENIRNSSHATFWCDQGRMCNEKLFAWNGLEDTFSILDTGNLEYNSLSCPIGANQPLSAVGGVGAATPSAPSVDEFGNTAALIVNNTTIRIYTIPHDMPEEDTKTEAHSLDHELGEEYGCPFAEVRWVHSHKSMAPPLDPSPTTRGRLIVTSPGGMPDPDVVEHDIVDVEGGRIIIFDFDPQYAGQPSQVFTFTLGKAPPQQLIEEDLDVATEVALVRRRTITQNRGGTLSQKPPTLGRAATSASHRRVYQLHDPRSEHGPSYPSPTQNAPLAEHAPLHIFSHLRGTRRTSVSLVTLNSEASRSLPDLLEATETAYEEPYTQGAPRSGTSLQRAATIANRHRFQALEERAVEAINPENLTLPMYTEVANQPLPGKYRKLAGLDIPHGGRIVFNPELMTAPPTIPEHGEERFDPFADISSTTVAQTLTAPLPLPLLRAYTDGNHSISPVGRGSTHSFTSEWGSVSPLLTRSATNLALRQQSSWETITTQTNGRTTPASQSTTHDTRQSPTPAAVPVIPNFSAPLRSYTNQPRVTDTNGSGPTTAAQQSDQLRNNHHPLVLPSINYRQVQRSSIDAIPPPSTASATIAHPRSSSLCTSSLLPSATVLPNSTSYARRQTPFQRAISHHRGEPSANLAHDMNMETLSLFPKLGTGTVGTSKVSPGSVPHPITNWYPPGPSRPSQPSSAAKTSSERATSTAESQHSNSSGGSTHRKADPTVRANSVPLARSDATSSNGSTPSPSSFAPGAIVGPGLDFGLPIEQPGDSGPERVPSSTVVISAERQVGSRRHFYNTAVKRSKSIVGDGAGQPDALGAAIRSNTPTRNGNRRSKSVGHGRIFGKAITTSHDPRRSGGTARADKLGDFIGGKGKGRASDVGSSNAATLDREVQLGHHHGLAGNEKSKARFGVRAGERERDLRPEFKDIEAEGKRCIFM